MDDVDFLAQELSRRYGTVKRARGCFLYTAKGVRLTDMYQEGGRAILGWGGGAAFTVLKNVLSRGLTGSFSTDFTPRIARALGELLFSRRITYVFRSREEALAAGNAVVPGGCRMWMPWAEGDIRWNREPCVVVEPPLPWTEGIFLLALSIADDEDADAARLRLTPVLAGCAGRIHIPAVIAAAVTRSIYDMIAALQSRSESDWFVYDGVLASYWERKGPYLYPKVEEPRYRDFLLHCLNEGIVISPDYTYPSIVPFGADKGVFSALRRNPFPL